MEKRPTKCHKNSQGIWKSVKTLKKCSKLLNVQSLFFCQLAHFIPNDGKKATKVLKTFGRVPKRQKKKPTTVKYNFFWFLSTMIFQWYFLEKYRINTVKISKRDKAYLNLHYFLQKFSSFGLSDLLKKRWNVFRLFHYSHFLTFYMCSFNYFSEISNTVCLDFFGIEFSFLFFKRVWSKIFEYVLETKYFSIQCFFLSKHFL